ncbi:MAG: sulfotransferase [Myxococcota bacterium]
MAARPLFVVGCHRSGTTLTRRILSTHPEVWLAKETQYLAFLPLADGDWHRPRTADALREHLGWIRPFLVSTGWGTLPERYPDHAEPTWAGVYQWVCGLEAPPGKAVRWWGDNTPRYVSLIPELDRAFPGARYIHVVRDPRDVVRSTLDVWFGGNTALTAAEEWMERVGAGLAAERLVGDRLLVVRFEDLLRDTAPTLARIARFLEVDDAFRANDTGQDAAAVASAHAHLANVGKPLDASVIGQYRAGLTPAQIAEVEQLTQPFLRALGYELDQWQPAWNPTPRFRRFAWHYLRSFATNLWRGLTRRLRRA